MSTSLTHARRLVCPLQIVEILADDRVRDLVRAATLKRLGFKPA